MVAPPSAFKHPRTRWQLAGGMADCVGVDVFESMAERALCTPEYETFCCIPGCMGDPHPASPHPVCASHVREMYDFGVSLVDDRWTEVLAEAVEATRPEKVVKPRGDIAGWVYFVRIGDHIKIGFSTYLKARFKDLRPDEVLAVIPGTVQDERRCHAAFAHLLERGREYFRPAPELLSFIDGLDKAA